MNITELARKLKITPNELRQVLPDLGFHIGLRAIQIPDKQAEKFMEVWQAKKKKEAAIQEIKKKISEREEKKPTLEQNKEVVIPPVIRVYNLAEKLNLPITKVMNELIKNGVLTNVNENLDYEIAAIIAENLGFEPKKGEIEQERPLSSFKKDLEQVLSQESGGKMKSRPPVVVVMGHVDHGKSAILSAIREVEMLSREAGGITQHIGAYQVEKNGRLITFIDTPGHEAFQSIRAQGGRAADIAILVIASDDKIQSQTLESIKVIQQEELPFIVAINKIDQPGADVERIKKELSAINLTPEDWGGKVICVPVSAKTKKGINDLLEVLNLVAEMEKGRLNFNPLGHLVGTVIEARLDAAVGPVATLIVYNGILRKGDNVIIGRSYGRVRSIKDQYGKQREEAEAGLPVQIFGLKGLPSPGDIVEVMADEKEFKKKVKQISIAADSRQLGVNNNPMDEVKKKEIKYLNIILKADVKGSLEAIVYSLEKLDYSEIKIRIIKKGLGNLNESDVELAKTTQALLVGFGVETVDMAKKLAKESNLEIKTYSIIYDLVEDIKNALNELLPQEIFEQGLGKMEVLKIFQNKNKEIILGGRVAGGKIIKDSFVRIWDGNKKNGEEADLKGEGKIIQLQINKQDVSEARVGNECGIKIRTSVATVAPGDILEIYQEIKKERKIRK